MTMHLKGVLFDFNGTLLFDSDMHAIAMQQAIGRHLRQEISHEFLTQHCFGRTNRTIYLENVNPNATQREIDEFAEDKERLYREACLASPDRFRLAPGAEDLLNALQAAGVPFCLATGSPWGNVAFYMEHLQLGRWFSPDNMVWDDETFPGKPDPEIFLRAASKLGLTPESCLVFEDGTSGILAANRANAGAVIAIYEEKYPSPLTSETRVNAVYHDHLNWRETLAAYGLLK